MKHLLETRFAGNTLLAWILAAVIILIASVSFRFLRHILVRRMEAWSLRNQSTWRQFVLDAFKDLAIPLLYAGSLYFALSTLSLPPKLERGIYIVFLVLLTYFIVRIASAAFKKLVYSFLQKQENNTGKESQASGLIMIVNGVIWIVGSIFLIDNLGYNVTTLVAGLGIGGIAIALAAQTILGDLFSYFVIFFDRPFEIGDFIIVDSKSGVVEHVGIKTTRIRTLSGEQLICSNTHLTNAQVHNYKRLAKRRNLFHLRVTYRTPHHLLAEIPTLVKDIISSTEEVEFNRGHFSAYGESNIHFEFVYYVISPDYSVFMDKQQAIYLRIFETFRQKGIEFAYPTQTVLFPEPTAEKQAKSGLGDLYFFTENH